MDEMNVLSLGYDAGEFSKIKDLILASSLPKELQLNLCITAEECFVNICSYAFDGPAPEGEQIIFEFGCGCLCDGNESVVMRFTDAGRQYDPREGLPDTDEYDIDNTVGGLGRYIAFSIVDNVGYEYREGHNILTLTKFL